ncbi:hypothetical protein AAC387_Pa07g0581 [Persea americana]
MVVLTFPPSSAISSLSLYFIFSIPSPYFGNHLSAFPALLLEHVDRCSSLLCVWGWAILVDQDFFQLWHLQKSLTLLAPPSGCGLCRTASTYTVKMIIPFVIFPFHFYKLKKSI